MTMQLISQLKPIHPFPARMAPAIVWEELAELGTSTGRGSLRVLDPMSGSGTTIAAARLLGHSAIGFDTDPLAVLIAGAWAADVDPLELVLAASETLNSARKSYRKLPLRNAYPRNADEETRAFSRYWFDETARRQLAALANAIHLVRPPALQDLLWCAFSRLLIVKSSGASLAMDVAHSRPHRTYQKSPILPFDHFEQAAMIIAQNAAFTNDTCGSPAQVGHGDARDLPLKNASVDCVITSPPYLNAIDYLRGHKFSLIWMGYSLAELRELRATNVGSEVGAKRTDEHIEAVMAAMGDVDRLPNRISGMLRRYVADLDAILTETSRVLAPGGRAVFVVGDSTLKQVFIRNSEAIALLGESNGLSLRRKTTRPLPPNRRYLPPPSSKRAGLQLGTRMAEEVILSFDRPN